MMPYRVIGEGGLLALFDETTGNTHEILRLASSRYTNFTMRSSPALMAEVGRLVQNYSHIESFIHHHISFLSAVGMLGVVSQYMTTGHYRNVNIVELGSGWGGITYYLWGIATALSPRNHLVTVDEFSLSSRHLRPGTDPDASFFHVTTLLDWAGSPDHVRIWDGNPERLLPFLARKSTDIVVLSRPMLLSDGAIHHLDRILKPEGLLCGVEGTAPYQRAQEWPETQWGRVHYRADSLWSAHHRHEPQSSPLFLGEEDQQLLESVTLLPRQLEGHSCQQMEEVLQIVQKVADRVRDDLGTGPRGTLKWRTMALKSRLIQHRCQERLPHNRMDESSVDDDYGKWRMALYEAGWLLG